MEEGFTHRDTANGTFTERAQLDSDAAIMHHCITHLLALQLLLDRIDSTCF